MTKPGYPCPECGARMDTIDSRTAQLAGSLTVRRRRECPACGHRLTTYEFTPAQAAGLLPVLITRQRRAAAAAVAALPDPPAI